MENPDQQSPQQPLQKFSDQKRTESFVHAGRGIGIFLKTTRNAWIQIVIFILAIFLGLFLRISYLEWIALVVAGGFVLTAEAFNTAIEIDINLTSPDYHPYARDTKDVAAGAVLLSAVTALIIGILVFGHHLL